MKKLSTILTVCLMLTLRAMAEESSTNAASAGHAAKTPPPGMENFKISGDAAKGQATYKLYCVACHGESGKGDGLAAAALNPKPRDFTDKERMAGIPDWEIFKVIKEGGASVGLSPLMTPWGALLKEDQAIHDVAAYVRSLSQ